MAKKKSSKKKTVPTRVKKGAKLPNVIKHPHVLNDDILVNPKTYKRAIGIDLGTKCGFAYTEYDPANLPKLNFPPIPGQFDLQVGEWETITMKFVRFKQFLNVILPDVIFFEDVKQAINPGNIGMMGGIIRSVEMLGALKAMLVTWAEEHEIPAHGFGIGQIKKHATGAGNVGKPEMIRACNAKWDLNYDDESYETTGVDNEVDAMFALDLGIKTYSEGLL